MHTLIINLTRLGDILQTQPVIHALKTKGHTIGFICLDNFLEACDCLSDLDYILPFPGNTISLAMNKSWYSGIHTFYEWIAHIQKTYSPDCILNLTPTISARILAYCLGINSQVKGFTIDIHGFGTSSSIWARFFEATTAKRSCSPYNVVDIFRKIANVDHIQGQYSLKKPSQKDIAATTFFINKQNVKTPYIGIQLGASSPYRQWPISHFAYLGIKLHEKFGITPILLGHSSEKQLAEEYKKKGAPCIDLIGKTSLKELGTTLSLLSLLITNDTGTMHLAAGIGTPSLALFLATAQAYDTAPYLKDCCCIEPALDCHPCEFGSICPHKLICHEKVNPEKVWMLLEFRLKNNIWPTAVSSDLASIARVWVTQKDSIDFLDLYSLSGHDKEDRTIWFYIQRHYYRQFLDLIDNPQINYLYQPLPTNTPLPSTLFKEQTKQTLYYISSLLTVLIEQGSILYSQPHQHIKKKFLNLIDQITTILNNSNQFNVLKYVWVASIQEHGGSLEQLLKFCLSFKGVITSLKKCLA